MTWGRIKSDLDTYFADVDEPTDEELEALEAEILDGYLDDALTEYEMGLTTSLAEFMREEGIIFRE